MLKKFCSNIVVILLIYSCNTSTLDPDPARLGFDFFPVQEGRFRIYQVNQIINNGFGIPSDSTHFQLKELVTDPFISQDGDSVFLLKRFTRLMEADPWELDSVWTLRMDPRKVVITENNVPFIKLVFPVAEGKSWDGNALNTKECTDFQSGNNNFCDLYEMRDLRKQLTLDTLLFNNTVTVIQQNDIDPTSTTTDDIRKEVFASGIGLVYKQIKRVSYLQCNGSQNPQCCCPDPNQFCTLCAGVVDQGIRREEILIAHGFE